MRVARSVAVLTAVVTGWAAALVTAQPAAAAPYCDVPVPPPACGPGLPEDPPPPPSHVPVLAFDGAQQTVTRDGVNIWGWTADDDAPTTPLTVNIHIDGTLARSMVANQHRPDVAAVYPRFGAAHGFQVVLPASAAGHNVCVTAISVGGGANKQVCRQMDDIVEFMAYDIDYDLSRAQLVGTSLQQLDKVTNRNDTTLQQSTEISGTKSVTETEGWSDTAGVRVSVSTSLKAGFPIFAEGKVTVSAEGSFSFTQNGSTSRTRSVSWRQPVLVPARSIVEATVTVTHANIRVPYSLSGDFIYRSGARAAGTVGGMFAGGNSENVQVNLKQYNLDGTPAAAPAAQPKATLLKIS
ncbi:ETX/MTX2 family pore-forming toxin [Micromonospora sp. NBC_01739]|uniref:ETX/MTX2 family pore-forming toxin n=1 Tax=Micromonospora sp. NBC_01739 TaxID=2975985 RepID=UPI002E14476A|nr:ETX/MTX2 family pore-forming toxin [Micromonospora sp. NBC_01739]